MIESYTTNGEFGYIEPGHGLKGKQEWLFTEEDVSSMIDKHKKAREVRLWCYESCQSAHTCSKTVTKSRSPECQPESAYKRPRTTKYDGYVKTLAKVDEIFKELDEKHHGEFSPEQLNAWAHLVQSGKYTSLDKAPDMPFIRGKDKRKDCSPSSPLCSFASVDQLSGCSPGR